MKLLFAIKRLSSSVGGAERVLCAVSSGLAQRGHDVTIVTFDRPGSQPFYHLDAQVNRIDLGIGNTARGARLGETLRRMHALRRVALETNPQVAVGFMHSMFVPLAFALIGSAIPVVGSEHIVPEHYRTRPLQYALTIGVSPFLSKVTVLSEAIRTRYPAPMRRRMVVMPNPVMPATGQADVVGGKNRYVLLNVGRLDAQKDHATLLRAFSRIAAAYPNWDLRIIGEGPRRHELENLVHGLDLEGRIHMPGVTSEIEVEYCGADAFVISSRYEAFGLVTAEAMSYGLPVIGFADCPGTNELIENDRTGLLVASEKDRVQMLASELEQLFSSPDLRHRLGQEGKKAIGSRFDIDNICGKWESLLASAQSCHEIR